MKSHAKAIVPAVATLLAIVLQWALTGEFDRAEAATAIGGILTAGLTWLVPNA